jgi:hypothetical protein
MVIASSCSSNFSRLECVNATGIADLYAISDTGATSIFVMIGTLIKNLGRTDNPITVCLPDGSKVSSAHICNINIPGLLATLMGHIIPGNTIASLIGIRILCTAGCQAVFNYAKFKVFYNNDIVLQGYKDPVTDVWTLPITHNNVAKTTLELPPACTQEVCAAKRTQQQPGPCIGCSQCNPILETTGFLYTRTTKMNNVKFAHQSFCNPPIASLLKAINTGFLKNAPHLDAHRVCKSLLASPATAKGHLKQPRKGIRSTTLKPTISPDHL